MGWDREQIGRMQGGVRAWVLRTGWDDGHGLRHVSPPVLLSLLCAAAFVPILTAAAGITGAVAAGMGVLSSVGSGVLGDVVSRAIARLGPGEGHELSAQAIEKAVAAQIEQALAAGDDRSERLRAEIATLLEEIDAGGTALRAAIETGSEKVRGDVVAAIGDLGSRFSEMNFLLAGINREAANILESLEGQDAKLRLIIDQNSRQCTEARLTREAIAAIDLRTRASAKRQEGLAYSGTHGNPYRGLLPFDETHAEVFYGRERLTAKLAGTLAERVATGGMVIVTGASGAGKSSLLQAGLLPALARGLQLPGSNRWPRMIVTPARHPLTELATHLAALGGSETATVRDGLAAHPGQAHLAVRQATLAHAARHTAQTGPVDSNAMPVVLVVDQFEQIFAQDPDEDGKAERQAFITALSAAANNPVGPHGTPSALVVIAVRGDFWDRCATHRELASAMQAGQFLVGPMTESDLRLAITGPADTAGLTIDAALVDTIMSDLRSAGRGTMTGVLPLLSQAMLLTWENREDNRLTSRAYARTGGVDRAVQISADAVYGALPPSQQRLARDLMKSMAIVSRDGQVTRCPVSRADLRSTRSPDENAQVDAVLESFAAKRLIVLSDGTAEIAHDALLNAWPRLRAWLDDDRANWIFHSQLAEDASAWHEKGDDPSFLYRGTQLAALQQADREWAREAGRHPAITAIQRDFLNASTRAAARTARQRRGLAALLVILLMASLAGAGIAARAAENAANKSNIELSAQLAAESEESDITNPVAASGLAAAAWRISPTTQAMTSMLDVLAQPNRGVLKAAEHEQAVAFRPGGKVLAIGSPNGRVELWDVATHRQLGAPIKPTIVDLSGVASLAFSPGGQVLATAGANVQLWDVATHRQLGAPIFAGRGGARSVAFSPDGKILAIGGVDGSIRLANVATHRQIGAAFAADKSIVYSAAFSPDGTILATSGDDGTARLWDVTTHRQIGGPVRASGSGPVYGVAFSPDGTALATVSEDGLARLWEVSSRQEIGTPLTVGDGGYMSAIAFSPSGETLATVSQDGAAQLWDVAIYRQIGPPLGASGPLQPGSDGTLNTADSPAFNPGGRILETVGTDGTVRLWDVASHREIGVPKPMTPHIGPSIDYAALSPDGKILATTSENGTEGVRLWNVTTHSQLGALMKPGADNIATTLAFSSDGSIVAAGYEDGKVRLWKVATHRQLGPTMNAGVGFAPVVSSMNSVAFSPNGKILATASDDGTVRLWDVSTDRESGPPLIQSNGPINTVAFSPNGSVLATGSSNGTVQLWDVATHQQIGASFTSGAGAVESVAFAPRSQILATGSGNGTVQLWDVATHQQIGASLTTGTGTIDPVSSVAFSPNGNILATSSDGGIRLWDVAMPADPLSAVCSIAGGSLSRAEWSAYMSSEPFQSTCP